MWTPVEGMSVSVPVSVSVFCMPDLQRRRESRYTTCGPLRSSIGYERFVVTALVLMNIYAFWDIPLHRFVYKDTNISEELVISIFRVVQMYFTRPQINKGFHPKQ
jgi:hypothetical protein